MVTKPTIHMPQNFPCNAPGLYAIDHNPLLTREDPVCFVYWCFMLLQLKDNGNSGHQAAYSID